MANRDLFRGMDTYENQRRDNAGSPFWQAWGRRIIAQAAAALLLFCGVVYLYEQESALGDGVRYVVALATTNEQQIMAVNSFADIWQDLLHKVGDEDGENPDAQEPNDKSEEQTETLPGQVAAVDYQPNADYLQAAPGNAAGNLVMILPASGLMQSAFGDIDEQGLSVDGLKIFCQNQQEVKAAAIGEVIEVVSGEKVVLRHRDGVLSYYQGAIEPAVQVGETLRQGQLLGRITESTLFFQVLRDEQPLDPFLFVKGPE